jgi:predicted cupin superfamily sugar epimerase/uncharacterized protein (DUF952 family)
MPLPLFHITTPAELDRARSSGALAPPSLASEGFVHCCFRDQIAGVLGRYFRGAGELALLELDSKLVGATRVESPPGASEGFPHVYGALPLTALRRVFELREREGAFELPEELRAAAASDRRELDELLRAYAWYDHPEGPKFVETHRDEHRTCGHWLFLPGSISAFHRVLNNEELWLAQRGRMLVHTLDERGVHEQHVLGLDVAAGETPVLAIPRGRLQAAEPAPGEPFAFGANVCAPSFHFREFELTPRSELLARHPQHRELVLRMTHG